ncbi:hypothetical protein SK128_022963, partial [Halocaridina rubra]
KLFEVALVVGCGLAPTEWLLSVACTPLASGFLQWLSWWLTWEKTSLQPCYCAQPTVVTYNLSAPPQNPFPKRRPTAEVPSDDGNEYDGDEH